MTVRWRLDLAYDGTDFSGWAVQPGRRTVQGVLQSALTTVLLAPEEVPIVCAGRTDAGVHARGQVTHADVPESIDLNRNRLLRQLDGILPDDLSVLAAGPAVDGFDARFSAVWRRYCYRLAEGAVDPLRRREVTRVRVPLDVAAMNAAAQPLIGLRDFGAFCHRRDGATTVRTLLDLNVRREATGTTTGLVAVDVRADAFCHSMVRSLVGGLVAVGSGRRHPDWLRQVAERVVRDSGVQVMPAHGLTLEQVGYPPDGQVGARAVEARAVRALPPEIPPSEIPPA